MVTTRALISATARTCWRNRRVFTAEFTVNAPLMMRPTDISLTTPVPSGAPSASANAGAINQKIPKRPTLEIITIVIAVGATSSRLPVQRTSVGSMPMSLTLAVTRSATAPTA